MRPKCYLDDFDPNVLAEPYATYTHGRTPYFRLHAALGHATNAMSQNKVHGCALFERDGAEWKLIARFDPNYVLTEPDNSLMPERCEGCGQRTYELSTNRWSAGKMVQTGKQYLERDGRGRLIKPIRVVFLCDPCRRAQGYR